MGSRSRSRAEPGPDQLTGSETGHSTFSYLGIALSGDTRDTIDNFLFGSGDRIQFHTVGAIDAEVTTGTMDNADFDADPRCRDRLKPAPRG